MSEETNHQLEQNNCEKKNLNNSPLSSYKLISKPPTQSVKNLLLDRFRQRKEKLIQSSPIYLNTANVKTKKGQISENTSLLSLIKQTSLQKLPRLQKPKQISASNRLSKTIDYDRSLNESHFSTVNSFQKSYNTIDIQSYQSVDCLNKDISSKRTSLDSIQSTTNNFNSAQKNCNKIDKNQRNSQNFSGFQLENQLKKKYLKSIVDRYFPSDQIQDQRKSKSIVSKNMIILQRLKVANPNVSLPSIIISTDGKKSLENLKEKQKNQNFERTLKKESQIIVEQQGIHEIDRSIFKSNPSALSLTQSYILEQISEDEEFEEHKAQINDFYENAAFYDGSGPYSAKSQASLELSGSMKDFYEYISVSKFQKNDQNKVKQKRQKVYENCSFAIYKVRTFTYQNLSQSNDIKKVSFQTQFRKYFKSQAALELKARELKAQKMIEASKNNSTVFLWQEDIFDSQCIKINLNKASTFLSQSPLSLSKLLYKISPYQTGSSSKFVLIQPTTSSKYQFSSFNQHDLLTNFHYGLLKFIKNIGEQLEPHSFSMINNKLSLNNIFMLEDDRFAINEWSYSFFKQQYLIQTKKFQKRLQPILKNQAGQWFVTPQYLAPEILQNLCYTRQQVVKYWKKIQGKKMQKAIVNENDLFQYGNKADVWSLGLMVLQIITLIPMWIDKKCIVQNKTSPKISPRKGLLHSENRNLLKILTKQSYLRQNLDKILRIQSQPYTLEEWLKILIKRMLDLDPKSRISFKQTICFLNKEEIRIKQQLKIEKK